MNNQGDNGMRKSRFKQLLLCLLLYPSIAVHAQVGLIFSPPSVCHSDYVALAEKQYSDVLDTVEKIVPQVSQQKIDQFTTTFSTLSQHCSITPSSLPDT